MPRRSFRRLIGAIALLALALLPAGPSQASPPPAGPVFGPLITADPGETTLSQFTQFTVSASSLPLGPATVRLRGVVASTVQVSAANPGDTTGGFGPLDLPVPTGAAACGSDAVTIDGVTAQATITVLCPTVTITPNPIFSAGTASDLEITATGLATDRTVTLAIDGQALPASDSDGNGRMTPVTVTGSTLACGAHQLTVTIQPPAGPLLEIRRLAAATTYPPPTVTRTITVLGCASSVPPPLIFADPFETGIEQFTQFSVEGFDLAAGPATIKLRGVTAGTVTVGTDGTFPPTVFTVPAGAAACGQDPVTIDDVTPAVAQSVIAVFCPSVTVTPNPVFSGGAPADLSIAGVGFPGNRAIDFTIDGQAFGTVTSDAAGSVRKAVSQLALACGDHQVVATAQPEPVEPGIVGRANAAHALGAQATVPADPPIPASADVTVLGCVSSPTPPRIHAIPIETTLRQFTRFFVDGSLLPAGPATIRLRGVIAGTVQVGRAGTFPTTDLPVPAGAAACGQDPVSIDEGGPVLATTSIAVYCPSITVAPNPVGSGGGAAVLNLSGVGFPPNRTVDLGFDGQNRTTVTSDAAGAIHGPIRGITPACGQHQSTAAARPPATAVNLPQAFLPISASASVLVVGCARITANPAVIPQGMLTHVTGTGFLPRMAVTLTWQSMSGQVLAPCARDAVSVPALATDAAGRIDVFCLAFPHEAIGAVRLTALQSPEQESVSVIIEDGSMQPSSGNPDQFIYRN
ncbi:MAG TPA: hypothetical protein VFU74_05485 [Actinocrinis sp.]|nr:hypothetical protein [Actinocrinis sp.]